MKIAVSRPLLVAVTLVCGTFALSGCGPKQVASAPPPPPPPPKLIPPRPVPPMGASATLVVPPAGPTGIRANINTGITPAQTTWNLRSAYNVAALNCLRPEHSQIVVGYRSFLTRNATALAAANRNVDAEYRRRYGASYIRPREAYMTQVYNYYAFPPTLKTFCDAALLVSNEAQAMPASGLDAFSARNLSRLDSVFEEFWRSYEKYRTDLAAWNAQYASPPAAPTAVVVPQPAPATVRN